MISTLQPDINHRDVDDPEDEKLERYVLSCGEKSSEQLRAATTIDLVSLELRVGLVPLDVCQLLRNDVPQKV